VGAADPSPFSRLACDVCGVCVMEVWFHVVERGVCRCPAHCGRGGKGLVRGFTFAPMTGTASAAAVILPTEPPSDPADWWKA